MKKLLNIEIKKFRRMTLRGFSLLETLMAVAVLSTVVAFGYLIITGTTVAAQAGKLQSDVATINNAVRTYLVNGGKLAASATPDEVLARLKTTADATSGAHMAGVKGSMLDARLRGIPATSAGTERAVWNAGKQRFEIASTGVGFSAFDLGGDPAAPVVEESRDRMLNLGVRDNWVWDHSSSSRTSRPAMRQVMTMNTAQFNPPPPPVVTRLAAPEVSIPGALYDLSAYNPILPVRLMDPNPAGTAKIYYSLDDGRWVEYTGSPVSIPAELTSRLRTYASPMNGDLYEDSEERLETYETIFFTGTATGNFHSPLGDTRLVTNLAAGAKQPVFKWGTPASGTLRQNSLSLTTGTFTRIAPDQEFQLGTLTYYNGTTASGTNATSVQVAVDLSMGTPPVRETLNFTFRLQSTPNRNVNADADADFVWIPDVSTSFRTTIKGQQFELILRFGEHGPNGFTTIDTFHAHEGKELRGTIYGRLHQVGGVSSRVFSHNDYDDDDDDGKDEDTP